MTYYARGRSRSYVEVWTYVAATLSYKQSSVSGSERITTVARSNKTSRVRIKPDGSHVSTYRTGFNSARTVEWQIEAYKEALETGRWDSYLDDGKQARRLETSPARRAWTAGAA